MTALTGTPVQNNYGDVLQMGNSGAGIDGTLRNIADGIGPTVCPLQVSTVAVNIASGGQLGGVPFGALATLNTVDTAQIDADAITTTEIENLAVTEAKLSSAVQTKLNASANNKFDATVDPDGDNDSAGTDATAIGTDGTAVYNVGSTWINTSTDQAYRCVDDTPTAAVWIETTLSTTDLGTMAVQNANEVTITGGTIDSATITGGSVSGLTTDITISDGGTGASNAADARTNLGLGSMAVQDSTSVSITGGTIDGVQIKDALTIFIENAANQQYRAFINIPFTSGTITNTTSRSRSGTCTATFSIGGVNLGGTANAVSTTEQVQAHASANTFSAGDDIEVTISANASCEGVALTIEMDRAI